MNNPLLEDFDLPPFGALDAGHFVPAIEQVLSDNRAGIEALLAEGGPWTWEKLAVPLDAFEDRLAKVFSPISHLNNVRNDEAVREAYGRCLELITRYETEMGQNRALYQAWQALREESQWSGLDTAQRKTVDNKLRNFRLAGVSLEGADRERFRAIQERLSSLQNRFEEQLLDANQAWTKHVVSAECLRGIPEPDLARAAARAADQDLDGWLFTLEFPDYLAVIQHADDRELRAEMHQAFASRASDTGPNAGEFDNGPVMAEILSLRQEAAELLDYPDFAELALADRMAESGKEVADFLHDLLARTRPTARKEVAALGEFARSDLGIETLAPWDVMWASEKRREALHAISEEKLRPYFPLETVLEGLFHITGELYGFQVARVESVDAWDPAVRLYELIDSEKGERIGRLFVDLYARPGKRGGAWMDECITRRRTPSGLQTPVAYLTCNFGAPAEGQPSLLNHDDVVTLFHEFGHCLQHLLTEVEVREVAGIQGVEWDAVELPSQFQEHFAWPRAGIDRIACHFETGESLPEDLYRAMVEARHFQAAMKLVRQIEFSLFDLRLHQEYRRDRPLDIQALLNEVREQVSVVPIADYDRFAHSFAHVFGGGYAAGYYSYLWAEVLSSDAFAAFEEAGLFDYETGRRFRHTVLGLGGSAPAEEVFRRFRGRDPELSAFLRHHGIGDAA